MQSFQYSLEDQPLPQKTKESFYPQPQLKPIEGKSKINYVKQYFETPQLLHIPSIDLNLFKQKIKTAQQVDLDCEQGQIKFIQTYPLGLLIHLNSQFCSNLQQTKQITKDLNSRKISLALTSKTDTFRYLYLVQDQQEPHLSQQYGVQIEFSSDHSQLLRLIQGCFKDGFYGFGFQFDTQKNNIYIGEFSNRKQQSIENSVLLYATGDMYVGGVLEGVRKGRGVYFKKRQLGLMTHEAWTQWYSYESIVLGCWDNDKVLSSQHYLNKTGLKDIFKMNLFRLEANLIIERGSVYCGNICIWPNQSDLSVHISRQGKGFEYFSKGDIYRGNYHLNKPHGEGHYIWSNKDEYIGDFFQGVRQGRGQWISSKGESYQGEFHEDKKNGYGVYKWNNGNYYEGEFKDDERDGKGKMVIFQKEILEGIWKGGVKQLQKKDIHFSSEFKNKKMRQKSKQHINQNKTEIAERKKGSESVDKLSTKKNNMLKQRIQRHSLAELPSSALNQVKISKLKQKLNIHESFYNARRQTFLSSLKPKDVTLNHSLKTDPTTNNQTISDQQVLVPLKIQSKINKSIHQQLASSEEKDSFQQGEREKNHKIKNSIKIMLKNKKKEDKGMQPVLGDTLLRPIKWKNFRYSWEQAYI